MEAQRRNWIPRGRAGAIADGENGVKVVEGEGALHLSFTFYLNYREILGSCLSGELFVFINILQMKADVVLADIE